METEKDQTSNQKFAFFREQIDPFLAPIQAALSASSELFREVGIHDLCKSCAVGDLCIVEVQIVCRRVFLSILTIFPLRIVWIDRGKELPHLPLFPHLPK